MPDVPSQDLPLDRWLERWRVMLRNQLVGIDLSRAADDEDGS